MSSQAEITQRFWKELAKSPYLMVSLNGSHQHSVPMTAQLDKDADHAFWFYTSRDNRLAGGGEAMAQYADQGHYLFACIAGNLVEERDPAVIDRYWSNEVAAWYPGGRNDPNLVMLRFDLGDAEIWLADMSIKGIFRMMIGKSVAAEEKGKHVEVAL
ncbi:MAG TPA: pyridoxamine 5'-phosphate oxidase family protein [Sphingobium sp.]